MELRRLSWYCAACDRYLYVDYSGPRIPFRRSPGEAARAQLLVKVDDHIDFHAWQFGNEIDSQWLEEEQE